MTEPKPYVITVGVEDGAIVYRNPPYNAKVGQWVLWVVEKAGDAAKIICDVEQGLQVTRPVSLPGKPAMGLILNPETKYYPITMPPPEDPGWRQGMPTGDFASVIAILIVDELMIPGP